MTGNASPEEEPGETGMQPATPAKDQDSSPRPADARDGIREQLLDLPKARKWIIGIAVAWMFAVNLVVGSGQLTTSLPGDWAVRFVVPILLCLLCLGFRRSSAVAGGIRQMNRADRARPRQRRNGKPPWPYGRS